MIAMEAGDRLGEASGPLALDVTSLATSPGRSAFPVLPVPPHPDIRVQNTDDYAVRPSNYHKSPRLQPSGIQTKRDRAVTFRVPAQPGATFRPEHTAPARATCTPRARRASTSIVGGEQTHGRSDGSPKPRRASMMASLKSATARRIVLHLAIGSSAWSQLPCAYAVPCVIHDDVGVVCCDRRSRTRAGVCQGVALSRVCKAVANTAENAPSVAADSCARYATPGLDKSHRVRDHIVRHFFFA